MSDHSLDIDSAGKISENIANESIEQIDFDQLRSLLSTFVTAQPQNRINKIELDLIKGEYKARIIGMLKAILAGRDDIQDRELAVRLSDDGEEITADELIRIYARTAAKFRTNFPATFNYLRFPRSTANGNNWKEHKI